LVPEKVAVQPERTRVFKPSKSTGFMHEPNPLLVMNVQHPEALEKYIEMDIV
jgi:hypothetical protein